MPKNSAIPGGGAVIRRKKEGRALCTVFSQRELLTRCAQLRSRMVMERWEEGAIYSSPHARI